MRRRDVPVTADLFEQITPGHPRESVALMHSIKQLHTESEALRAESRRLNSVLSQRNQHGQRLAAEITDLRRRLSTIESSRSWALTRPMRSIAHGIRTARR
jgi:hypothetical protein